jgi:beta-phosphoglucomutase-like phosphatase (HAD superfamily)
MLLQIPEGDFSGYIFDLDGTLVDTMPLHYTAWEAALRKAGLQGPLDEELFYELGGVPSRKVAGLLGKHHGLDLDPVAVYRDKEEAFMGSLEKLALIAPVVEFARRVSKDHPVAIASGGTRDVVTSTLTKTGLAPLFPVVVTADDVEHGKPAPDMFLLAAKLMGVPAEGLPRLRGRPAGHQGRRGGRDEVGLCLQPAVSVTAPGTAPVTARRPERQG